MPQRDEVEVHGGTQLSRGSGIGSCWHPIVKNAEVKVPGGSLLSIVLRYTYLVATYCQEG